MKRRWPNITGPTRISLKRVGQLPPAKMPEPDCKIPMLLEDPWGFPVRMDVSAEEAKGLAIASVAKGLNFRALDDGSDYDLATLTAYKARRVAREDEARAKLLKALAEAQEKERALQAARERLAGQRKR